MTTAASLLASGHGSNAQTVEFMGPGSRPGHGKSFRPAE